jgi:hypothetical protein
MALKRPVGQKPGGSLRRVFHWLTAGPVANARKWGYHGPMIRCPGIQVVDGGAFAAVMERINA